MAPSDCRCHISNNEAAEFLPEADRYVLYLQYGCPFAQRVNITLHLKGLSKILSLAVLDPTKTAEGFQFTGRYSTMPKDPLYGFSHIRQLYWKIDPDLRGPFTVPLLWDKKKEVIVNNESSNMMRMFYDCFDHLAPEDRRADSPWTGGLYPAALRPQIDTMNAWIQKDINAGVYGVADAETQETYDQKIEALFSALDRVELHLSKPDHQPFLFGKQISETDIRLFTSMIRFDVAYFTSLRCSKRDIRHGYPNIHKWMQTLYWDNTPLTNFGAFRKTTNFEHVKILYSAWVPHRLLLASPDPPILPLAKEIQAYSGL